MSMILCLSFSQVDFLLPFFTFPLPSASQQSQIAYYLSPACLPIFLTTSSHICILIGSSWYCIKPLEIYSAHLSPASNIIVLPRL